MESSLTLVSADYSNVHTGILSIFRNRLYTTDVMRSYLWRCILGHQPQSTASMSSGSKSRITHPVTPRANLAPIERISDDVAFQIFLILAEVGFYERPYGSIPPLTSIRRASQVCHGWRELILSLSVIWGRLIDLNVLKKKDNWRKEVIRRAGRSVLWITGTYDPPTGHFTRILKSEWSRIQRIIIRWGEEPDRELWALLRRPTIALEDITLDLNYRAMTPISVSEEDIRAKPLFGGTAPSLIHFESNPILCCLDTSWVTQLRTIDITLPFVESIHLFLGINVELPQLKFLRIELRGNYDLINDPPTSAMLNFLN